MRIGLDMTRRDLQNEMKKQGRPWCIGKAFEQSAPIGPIQPIAGSGQLLSGAITLPVNGATAPEGRPERPDLERQRDHRAAQRRLDLQPGDLIFTGTPAGVGAVGAAT